jgi:hypothetical protein
MLGIRHRRVNGIAGICICDVEMYTLARCGDFVVELPCSGWDQLIPGIMESWMLRLDVPVIQRLFNSGDDECNGEVSTASGMFRFLSL